MSLEKNFIIKMKTRGLNEANEKLGNIERVVEKMLKTKKKIKIFESGCGYGRLMIDLTLKYRDKIEIIGMNLKPEHGDKNKMIKNALKEGIVSRTDLKKIKIPKIIYGDASKKIPFKNNSIDLILSQVSSYLYKDKLHFYEEVARVLKKGGIARLTFPETKGVPERFLPLFKYYRKGKLISLKKLTQNYKEIQIIKTSLNPAIEIKKGNLKFNAKLEASINLNNLNKDWFGVQSIYFEK
jgi:ubiquinone/menaquinone biosynthesis C-methylase UbiE